MRKISLQAIAFLILTAFGLQTASNAEPSRLEGGDSVGTPTPHSTGFGAAFADEGPRLVKTRIFVKLWQNHSYWPSNAAQEQYDTTSWLPDVRFRISGPIAGGSQLSVDVTRPDGSLWVSLDCPTAEIGADRWIDVETPRQPPGATKVFTTGTGVYGFEIRLKNALSSQNQSLFSGKFKVSKVDKSKGIPKFKNTFTYYVDHDWTLPFGYVWAQATQANNVHLVASMWFKGAGPKAAYVFYKGQQVASTKESGSDISAIALSTFDNDTADPRWERIEFTWYSANFTAPGASTHPSIFFLDKNPGDYEIKVLCGGALCRETKFKIGSDGKIADNGLATANKLNITSVMVPVKVLGTADGPWQPMAWKTDAFYANPLQGFTAP